ncbi:MAG: NAD(P)H-dependent glycerol-3-phosphate dehydrogenase [Candidatus Jorgensenbacteria bacterium]
MTKVLIIGAGELGTALAHVLKKKRNLRIERWDKNPSRVRGQRPLAQLVPEADFILLCVPSWAMKEALGNIRRWIARKTIAVSFAKGIEHDHGNTMDKVLAASLPPHQPFALVSGHMLAEELQIGKRGKGLCAATSLRVRAGVIALFRGTSVSLLPSANVRALALAGVLKNVYALTLGIADGLGWNATQKKRLTEKAIKEMGDVLAKVAKGRTLAESPAGRGDLIATGYSKYSRNRLAGENLARGRGVDFGAEGVASLKPLLRLLGKHTARFPLLTKLKKIVVLKKSPREFF